MKTNSRLDFKGNARPRFFFAFSAFIFLVVVFLAANKLGQTRELMPVFFSDYPLKGVASFAFENYSDVFAALIWFSLGSILMAFFMPMRLALAGTIFFLSASILLYLLSSELAFYVLVKTYEAVTTHGTK